MQVDCFESSITRTVVLRPTALIPFAFFNLTKWGFCDIAKFKDRF